MKNIYQVTQEWLNQVKDTDAKRQAELEVESDAADDYYERTGKRFHWLSITQQRNVIEAYMEKK